MGANTAWAADETKGAYKVTYDFETTTGLTIHGNGYFTDYGDGFGQVFHNGGGARGTHYLLLPSDLLSHSNVSKELTIGFWVSAKGMVPGDYTYAPFFSAFGQAPHNITHTPGENDDWTEWTYVNGNEYPMFALQSRGLLTNNIAGYCDFGDALNVNGTNAVYNTNAGGSTNWLADNEWHYYTVTMTATSVIIYLDGDVKNQWTIDGTDGKSVNGIFSNGSELRYICLGGNQAWEWNDNDMPFSFDDFLVTNEALSATAIEAILDAKVLGIAQALYDDATCTTGKDALLTAINTLTETSSAANRTALYTAIDTYRKANAKLTRPYSVALTNADFANGTDDWNASGIGAATFTWGHDGTWNRWLESFSSKTGENATGISTNISISQTLSNMPAGRYTAKAYIASRGYTSSFSLSDGTTPATTVVPASEFTLRTVDYDLAADGNLTIAFNYTAGETLDTRCEWVAIDDVELIYYGPSTAYTTDATELSSHTTAISDNKGDITSLINGTFDENADGWTFTNQDGGTKTDEQKTAIDRYNGTSWRGGTNYYVDCNNRWYTISTTLNNMPAGTYKLVAAMRGSYFGIQPSLAGTAGSYFYGANETMINTNGVQFPVSDITKNGMNFGPPAEPCVWTLPI